MKDPAFPMYAADFILGTMFMSFEDIGRYAKLLCYQWDKGNIPKKRLGLLVGLEWVNFGDELREKFIENDSEIYNERLEKEREKRVKFKEKQVINGSKGGRPKKGIPVDTPVSENKNPNETQTKPKRKPKKSLLENENEYINKDILFDLFWDLYDKKVGEKTKIKKKWDNLTDEERNDIIAYIPKYKIAEPDKQFRKNPETFLNNKSWHDELIQKKKHANYQVEQPLFSEKEFNDKF